MITFHATSKENVESILKNGFSIEKQGENGSFLGNGIYVAGTKNLAKKYGKCLIRVVVDDSKIYRFDDFYSQYPKKCKELHKSGVKEEFVNSTAGQFFKDFYLNLEYQGIIIPSVLGTSFEMVIYDNSIIQEILI